MRRERLSGLLGGTVLIWAAGWSLTCGSGSTPEPGSEASTGSNPLEISGEPTADAAPGVRRIPIDTPSGRYEVWTRKVGDNPDIKVLLLHGGPGASHEYLLNFEDHLPEAGIEMYFYDQLGSYNSDQPDDPDLWTIERFVDEVEQVRAALELDADNFYLYGQSWGGLLAIEYALEHQDKLKGLIISNMMSSIPAYNKYAAEVLMADMDPAVLAEIQALEAAEAYDDPRYQELLLEHHYVEHILRRPPEEWPDYVNAAFEHLNTGIYIPMQGPSELGASGVIEDWDRSADLGRITVPTLVIGATHDTMDPAYLEWMAGALPNGRFLLCPDGSHFAHIDDEEVYFDGLIRFLEDVNAEEAR